MWNASRWAVRLPMPGSLPSSVTSRWRGGASKTRLRGRAGPARRGRRPGRRARRSTPPILSAASSCAERSASLTAARTMSCSISTSSGSTASGSIVIDSMCELAGGDDLDHAAARGRLDPLVLERLLRGHHLLLHLLDLLEHLLHVGLGRHQDVSSGSSGRQDLRLELFHEALDQLVVARASARSSSGRVGRAARARAAATAPVTARIARPISSRLAASSALRLDRPAVSAHASVSSPSPSADGRATFRCSAQQRPLRLDRLDARPATARRRRRGRARPRPPPAPAPGGSTTATAATDRAPARSAEAAAAGAGVGGRRRRRRAARGGRGRRRRRAAGGGRRPPSARRSSAAARPAAVAGTSARRPPGGARRRRRTAGLQPLEPGLQRLRGGVDLRARRP